MQVVCETFLKEIKGITGDQNHKVVDIWILLIIHANGGAYRKAAEQLLLKKISSRDIGHGLLRQCIQGRGDSVKVSLCSPLCVDETGHAFCEEVETEAVYDLVLMSIDGLRRTISGLC